MKILIDARLYGLENTGLGRYVMNLVSGLAKEDDKNEYVILLRRKYFGFLNLPENWKKICVDFHHYSFAEQFKLPRIIQREKPDIVHFPHFNVPLFYGGKYVVTVHDILMHKSIGLEATTLSPIKYFIKRLGYRLVFDSAIKKAFKIIVPSNAVKGEIINEYQLNKDKVVVTYEGFDEKILGNKEMNIQKPYFIYIGNAYPHKNLGNLIKAIKILNTKSHQKVTLAISGARNIFTQRIENVVKSENAEEFVKILGFVSDEKLGKLLLDSVAFTFPSLSEGFGLPGLEAMNVGTLLLASNIPVHKEVYKENAIYFDPMNSEKIAECMERALKMSSEERERRIKEAKEFVKIYSWDKMARETLKIYESSNSVRQSQ